MADRDWYAWHDDYQAPGTRLARRPPVVQERVRIALDEAPPGCSAMPR